MANICSKIYYHLYCFYYTLYEIYDDWKNPPCETCGAKNKKN